MSDVTPIPGSDLSSLSFDSLIASLRNGNERAAQQLIDKFGPLVVRVIRRRMNARLRGRFDSQDFTQAVWASFFGNISEIGQFANAGALVRFLSRVASNKVIDAGRKAQVRHEGMADGLYEEVSESQSPRLSSPEPTPSQHAMARESWDQLIRNEDDFDRQLLELRRQGMTQQEIAERMGISERQVRRILLRVSRKVHPDSM